MFNHQLHTSSAVFKYKAITVHTQISYLKCLFLAKIKKNQFLLPRKKKSERQNSHEFNKVTTHLPEKNTKTHNKTTQADPKTLTPEKLTYHNACNSVTFLAAFEAVSILTDAEQVVIRHICCYLLNIYRIVQLQQGVHM